MNRYLDASVDFLKNSLDSFSQRVRGWDLKEWNEFGKFLTLNGLEPLFYSRFRFKSSDIPGNCIKSAEKAYYKTKTKNAYNSETLISFAEDLHSEGIDLIALKSICLSEILYKDIGLRPYADIDILIKKEDINKLVSTSGKIGIKIPRGNNLKWFVRNHYEFPALHKSSELSRLDIHWNIALEKRHNVDAEELWRKKVLFPISENNIHRLSNEHTVVNLAVHLGYHCYSMKLSGIYDFFRFCSEADINWDEVDRCIKDWKIKTICGFSFELLNNVFGFDIKEKGVNIEVGKFRKILAKPLRSNKKNEIFRLTQKRIPQLIIGFLTIDRPSDQLGFSIQKIVRKLRYGGEPWPCDLI